MYSISILLSCLEFLNKVNYKPQKYNKFIKRKIFIYTTPIIILNNLKKASLINIKNGYIFASSRGRRYVTNLRNISMQFNDNVKRVLRELFKEFLIAQRVEWLFYVNQGRYECLDRIKDFDTKKSMVLIMKELNLLTETDTDVINWWDDLRKAYNNDNDEKKIKIGRMGEELSIKYEIKRVGRTPYWESVFSNKVGYDLQSIVSKNNEKPLRIEIKASTKNDYTFFVTRNEWKTALLSDNYIFHFWNVIKKELLIFKPIEIEKYIPLDKVKSEWIQCKIKLDEEDINKFYVIDLKI